MARFRMNALGVTMESFLRPWSTQLLSILRIMTGLLLLQHGTSKYLNFPVSSFSNASPTTMVGAGGVFELICGGLLTIGLFTRPAAFILSGMNAVVYFYVNAPRDFFPLLNGGSLAILFCFTLLYIAAAGGGAWSLDKTWRGMED
jgi:putative oxidoreductase